MPYLAINPASYGRYREGCGDHIAALGVKHVELGVPGPEAVDGVRTELARTGLSLSSAQMRLDLSDADSVQSIARQAHTARDLGARYGFISVKAGGLGLERAYERLREAGELAAAHDVVLVVETHPDLAHNGDVARQTMEAVDHPGVRVNYDTANVLYYSDGPTLLDSVTELTKVLPWVASLHLKEYASEKPRAWAFPALGEGSIDFGAIVALLRTNSFEGPLTLELEGCEGEELTREQQYERVRKSVEVVRALGITE
jgi:sugar phosphate isomerase/epimerase